MSRVENITDRVVPRCSVSPEDLCPGTMLFNVKNEIVKKFENDSRFEIVFNGQGIKKLLIGNFDKQLMGKESLSAPAVDNSSEIGDTAEVVLDPNDPDTHIYIQNIGPQETVIFENKSCPVRGEYLTPDELTKLEDHK